MSTPQYDQTIYLSNLGSSSGTTGNPPRDWDNTNKEYKLLYSDACFKIEAGAVEGDPQFAYVNLTGTRKLTSDESSSSHHIGEMLVDRIDVHVLNSVGALVEFSKDGEVQGSATLVNGVGEDYIPAAHLSVQFTLLYHPLP